MQHKSSYSDLAPIHDKPSVLGLGPPHDLAAMVCGRQAQKQFSEWQVLIVLLVENRFPVPAQALQQLAIGFDHLVQAANVGVHVGAALNDPQQVVLNISSQTLPFRSAATERRQITKV